MSERNDYKTLKDNLPRPNERFERVENLRVDGMPDVNYCAKGAAHGVEMWIELKSPNEPKRSSTRLFGSNHKLSQEQMNWFKRQLDAGGRAWVLISTDKRWLLVHGRHADVINDLTVDELLGIATYAFNKPVRNKQEWKTLRIALLAHWE